MKNTIDFFTDEFFLQMRIHKDVAEDVLDEYTMERDESLLEVDLSDI